MEERRKIKCKHCPTRFIPRTWNAIMCGSEECKEKNRKAHRSNAATRERSRRSYQEYREKELEKDYHAEWRLKETLNRIREDIKETGGDKLEYLIRNLMQRVRQGDSCDVKSIVRKMTLEMANSSKEISEFYSELMPGSRRPNGP